MFLIVYVVVDNDHPSHNVSIARLITTMPMMFHARNIPDGERIG